MWTLEAKGVEEGEKEEEWDENTCFKNSSGVDASDDEDGGRHDGNGVEMGTDSKMLRGGVRMSSFPMQL